MNKWLFEIENQYYSLQNGEMEKTLVRLQQDLNSERTNYQDSARQLTSTKKHVTELQDELHEQKKFEKELEKRVRGG